MVIVVLLGLPMVMVVDMDKVMAEGGNPTRTGSGIETALTEESVYP